MKKTYHHVHVSEVAHEMLKAMAKARRVSIKTIVDQLLAKRKRASG